MDKLAIIGFLAILLTGCSSNAPRAVQNSNSNQAAQRDEKMQSVVSHTTENQPPPGNSTSQPTGPKAKWTQSGNPIDTKELDTEIAKAEKARKTQPKDAAANSALAEAYFKRGFALTEARQYASALGDYRRTLKYDAANEEAKKWIEIITSIYNSKNQDYPKEGEEPPPLPFNKEK